MVTKPPECSSKTLCLKVSFFMFHRGVKIINLKDLHMTFSKNVYCKKIYIFLARESC